MKFSTPIMRDGIIVAFFFDEVCDRSVLNDLFEPRQKNCTKFAKKHRDDRFFFLAIFYDSSQSFPSRESVRGCVIYFSRDCEIYYTDKEFARKNYGIIGAFFDDSCQSASLTLVGKV